MIKYAAFVFLGLFAILQYKLWIATDGISRTHLLNILHKQEETTLSTLELRNKGLKAEVEDLRSGKVAIEEHARTDLNMVKKGTISKPFMNF